MKELDEMTYSELIREKESLIDFINTETRLGGSARTEYRQLDAIQEEIESRETEE